MKSQAPGTYPADHARNAVHDELRFTYRNWRGEVSERRVKPHSISFRYRATNWHPEPQWIMNAFDFEKENWRDFAWADIIRPADHAAIETPAKAAAGGVKARELPWSPHATDGSTHISRTPFGDYVVWEISGRGLVRYLGDERGSFAGHTLDDAKAAAQADFERRILSCIAAHPVESEVADLRAEVERLKAEVKELEERTDGYWSIIEKDVYIGSSREKANLDRAKIAEAALALVKEELASTLEELIDHNGDSLDDARANRVRELRSPAALSTPNADRAVGEKPWQRQPANRAALIALAQGLGRFDDAEEIAGEIIAGLPELAGDAGEAR